MAYRRYYLDVAREGGRTAKLARLGAPALTWDELDRLLASVQDGTYEAPAQPVAPAAPTPLAAPHVGLEPDVFELEKYRA
jgi:hypothetical protein